MNGQRKHRPRRPALPCAYLGGPVVFTLHLQTDDHPLPTTSPLVLPSFLSTGPPLSNKKNLLITTCPFSSNTVATRHVRLLSTCSNATEELNFYFYIILSNLNVNGSLWLVATCWRVAFPTFVFNHLAPQRQARLGKRLTREALPAEPRGRVGMAGQGGEEAGQGAKGAAAYMYPRRFTLSSE